MNDFFMKKGVSTLNIQDTYEFVTDFNLEDLQLFLNAKIDSMETKDKSQLKEEEQKDAIFKNQYIPRSVQELTLDDIYRMEREGNKEEIEKFQKLANF